MAFPTRGFRLLAVSAAVSAWALVALGGVVRVTESGLGCPDWPLCTADAVPLRTKESAIEYSHRALVAIAIALVVWLCAWAWRYRRSRPDVFWSATAVVLLVPLQAILGAVAVWLELPGWVVAFHFIVGMIFLATTVLAAACAFRAPRSAATAGLARFVWGTTALSLALVSLGAAVVAIDAGTACGKQWPGCNGGFAVGNDQSAVQVAHRMLAYAVAVLAVALFLLAWRRAGLRFAGALLLAAVLAQLGFGIGLVLVGGQGRAYEIFTALHVGGAGTVWALLVALSVLVAPPPRARDGARPLVAATARI